MTNNLIELRGVSKRYGEGDRTISALSDIDLTVHRGQLASIIGPSGSGKSTLLNLVSGLDSPTTGTVTVDGLNLSRASVAQRAEFRRSRIAVIFQFANLIDILTAEQNVALPLRAAHLKPAAIERRTADAIKSVGLTERRHHYPSELSGGELQRVGIARALVTEAPVILADEPTGSLDTLKGEVILELLRTIVDEREVCVILVTHDLQAASYGDRIITLRDGRIVDDVDGAGPAPVVPLHDDT